MLRLNWALASVAIAALAFATELQAQQPTPQQNAQRGRQATDQPRDRSSQQQQQGGIPLTEAIVQKLIKSNEGEIELAKLAGEKSENSEVKQFAQSLVDDHQALIQKLKQMAGDHNRGANTTVGDAQQRTPFQQTATQLGQPGNTPGGTPGQNPTANPGQDTPGQNNQSDQPGQRGQAGQRNPTDQAGQAGQPGQRRGQNSDMQGVRVPHQLTQIMEEACDNSLKMTKEMLSNYQGQDFQMAFLGQQIVAHIEQLAELKALENSGPEELKSLVGEASKKVQAHLEKAKQLAKKLEDDRKNS
jgi:predicted outer membrane protein